MISRFSLQCILAILLFFSTTVAYSQVTVGSAHAPAEGALLDLKEQLPDTDNVTAKNGGLLLPRVKLYNTTSMYNFMTDTLSADYVNQKKLHTGLIVYNINADPTKNLEIGIYQWNGTKWLPIKEDNGGGASPWNEVGTTSPATDNLKDAYLRAKVVVNGPTIASIYSPADAMLTVMDKDASIHDMTVGRGKGYLAGNTAIGKEALNANTTGNNNTAIGFNALKANTTGTGNTAIGYLASSANTTGNYNTIIGNESGNAATGSNNLVIGNNIQVTGNNKINIGNTIFGTTGTGTTSATVGKISIGMNGTTTSNLHVHGDMILRDVQVVPDGEALLIDSNGKMGVGALLPTPTPHCFYQSTISKSFNSAEASNFNGPDGYIIPWTATDRLSNNMTTYQTTDNSFLFANEHTCKISGYIGLQFLNTGNNYPATSYNALISTSSGLAAAVLEIQMALNGSSTWTTIASGHQVWYGAALISTVKVIQIPPTVVKIPQDSRIRMVVKKASGLGISIVSTGGNQITKPGGADYAKGLTIVALR
ncbi:hypothetical protein [Prevotella sp. 10(H)]|uniref:hypothetical protein n=1 Tax=Prevotella sp. 10(H) TaxID=1158294 RepID=UPI0004A756F0|nr:hypothetical protein [Prevotella sp. 10(H)]